MTDRVEKLEDSVAEMRADLSSIKSNYATKSDVADLRADLYKISSDISRWTLATLITVIGVALAAIVGLSQIYKSQSQLPAPPIIVTMPGPA